MSDNRPRYLGRAARLLWGGLGVVLLVFLGFSFLLSDSALEDAEADAEERAQGLAASVLFTVLTPDLVSGDILGPDYRDLLIHVQAGILADGRVVQVRVWKPDGDLIFSTAQRDAIDEFVAQGDPNLERAAGGETVSAIVEATVSPRQGLQGSDEKLYQTYVPLQPPDSTEVVAVVQIDQRYAAIEDEANRIWRRVQIGLIVPLGLVAVLFGISLRAPADTEREPKPRDVRRDERKLKDAEARATAAERAAREVEERLAEAERRLKDAAASEVPPDVASRMDELELKLRAEVAEREQFAAEVQRLRTTIAEREAEIARIRDATPPPAATEPEGIRELIASTERRAEEAEARLSEATSETDRQIREATALAGAAETRATQAEARTKEAETRAEATETTVADLRASLAEAESRIAASEAKLVEAAAQMAAPSPTASGRGRSRAARAEGEADEKVKELEARLNDLEAKRRAEVGELQRAQESFANTQVELLEVQRKLKAAEARVRELESGGPPPAQRAAVSASSGPEPGAEGEPSLEFGSFASRLSSLRQEIESQIGPEQEQPAEEPPADEALSLRERLARAAAARHRVGGSDEE